MFSFKAIVRDSTDGSEYRLEYPLGDDDWHLYHNGQELELKKTQMYRDGGTTEATFVLPSNPQEEQEATAPIADDSDDETLLVRASFTLDPKLIIPQQISAVEEPESPTINGRPLELREWWIGGKQYLNGTVL